MTAAATAAVKAPTRKTGVGSFLIPVLGLAVVVAVWHVWSVRLGEGHVLASFAPARTVVSLWELLRTGALEPHILVSLKRVMLGLLIGLAAGLPLGVLLGIWSPLERASSFVFQFVRMTSPLSWMPIAVMAFGIGDAPVYFLIGIASVFPIMLNTRAGVANLDRRWILAVRSLGANRWETVRYVVLPAVLTHSLVGLRLAVGIAWIVLVPAEMLGVSAGLGYYLLDTRDRLAYSELMAVILVIGALGYLLDLAVRGAQWLLTPHRRE